MDHLKVTGSKARSKREKGAAQAEERAYNAPISNFVLEVKYRLEVTGDKYD